MAIDVLLTGDFPGDVEPKPRGIDGLPYLPLTTLIELKLASGMTAPDRPRDLTTSFS